VKAASIYHAFGRGIFHAVVGLASATSLFFFPRLVVLTALAVVTVAFLTFEAARLRAPSLKQRFSVWFAPLLRAEEESKFTGSSYFLIGCLMSVLVFPRDIAILAIIFLSVGDPSATIVGMWKGRTRLWGRSVEGDVACLIVCLLAGVLVAGVLQNPPLIVAIVGAVFGGNALKVSQTPF